MPTWRAPIRSAPSRGRHARVSARASAVRLENGASLAGWAYLLGPPRPEPRRSQQLAHLGGLVSILALLLYLTWRVAFTMPEGGWDSVAAWTLVVFEAVPLAGLLIRIVTLWNIDSRAPRRVTEVEPGLRAAVWIPTYNEPVEVIAPTIAAACALEPAHETWVLDDGDRPWVAELCDQYGARYVNRPTHEHAKAGNMNHALALMAEEEAQGAPGFDVLAVLDCDHVPLPTFLTDTLGWFDDPKIALVQGPQSYYNSGAFDDDGVTGEQGMFFHVLLPARNHDGAGPFWCGSTSLIRTSALREIGGIATETIVEDMHTTLGLIRQGWKTVYHHQTVALGLAPATARAVPPPAAPVGHGLDAGAGEREAVGGQALAVLAQLLRVPVRHPVVARRRRDPLRVHHPADRDVQRGPDLHRDPAGVHGGVRLDVPAADVGDPTSVPRPPALADGVRAAHLPGPHRHLLPVVVADPPHPHLRGHAQGRRRRADPGTRPARPAGPDRRRHRIPGLRRGRCPRPRPWRTSTTSTIASGSWLLIADLVLILGTRRITATDYATSRRNAHRTAVTAAVTMAGGEGELVDISVGGAAVRFPAGTAPTAGQVELQLPGADPVEMSVVRVSPDSNGHDVVSCRLLANDWEGYRAMSLWLFHTPAGVVGGMPTRCARGRRQQVAQAAGRCPLVRPVRSGRARRHVSAPDDMTARAWLALLLVGAFLAGVNAVGRGARARVWTPSTSSSPGCPWRGCPGRDPAQPTGAVRTWVIMTVGLTLLVVGDALGARRGVLLHGDRDPSAGDAAHLVGYICVAASLLLLAHDRRPGDRAGRLESWIVSAAAALVFVELLIRPSLDAGPGTTTGTVVSVAYPAGDVLLVLGMARFATAAGGRTRAGRLLLSAGGLLLLADTISILLGLYSTPDHRPGDLLRLLSYTAFGAAALHPTMAALSRPTTRKAQSGPSRWRLLVVGLAALIAPALLAAEELLGVEHDSWAIVVGASSCPRWCSRGWSWRSSRSRR